MKPTEATGIAVGIVLRVGIGAAIDNIALGIGGGVAVAIAMGLVFRSRK
jgi:hypothetical protein